MKGIIIAGTHSGSGKTTITMGLMLALINRGFSVAPFKVGPDFIDPGHHTNITGHICRNLDGWMLSKSYNIENFAKNSKGHDISVVEGVMGLFDGYSGKTEAGSTAQMAKWLNLPVLLIVNARSMARSAAAIVKGFEEFDKNLKFAGVIFNNVASKRHLDYLEEALIDNVNMPCLGGIPGEKSVKIEERHLGLITQDEFSFSSEKKKKLSNLIEENLNIDLLIKNLPEIQQSIKSFEFPKPSVKIGVARDKAFCFYYEDNLDFLKKAGAEIIYFSPLKDKELPSGITGVYFGGGYPELFAKELSNNNKMLNSIKEASENNMPVYAECGGFMYLCKDITNTEQEIFPMVGCFPFSAKMYSRLKSLGYREITLNKDIIIGKKNEIIRGHEFHYSGIDENQKIEMVYNVTSRLNLDIKNEGFQVNKTLGSYIHLHFGSCPSIAESFIKACKAFKS